MDKANYLDGGYLIYQNEKMIGGVILTPNFMTDLFLVPPYTSYETILRASLEVLSDKSNDSKPIVISEVPEMFSPYYESENLQISDRWMWMIRPTEKINFKLPEGYMTVAIDNTDKDEVAELLNQTYRSNPCFISYDTKEDLLENVNEPLKYKETKPSIYSSLIALIDKESRAVIGVILMMEDDGLPLIIDIVVKPEHQKKGLASYLIQYSINELSDHYTSIRLSVDCDNGASKLYKKLGFQNTMSLINYEYSKRSTN